GHFFRGCKLDSGEQAHAADFLHHFEGSQFVAELGAKILTEFHRTRTELLRFEDVERREACTHGEAVFAEGGSVDDGAAQGGVDGAIDFVCHQHRADGHEAAAEGFRQNYDVGEKV